MYNQFNTQSSIRKQSESSCKRENILDFKEPSISFQFKGCCYFYVIAKADIEYNYLCSEHSVKHSVMYSKKNHWEFMYFIKYNPNPKKKKAQFP